MSGGGRAVPARALKAVTPAPIEEREADRLDVRVSQGRLHAAHVRAVAQAVAEFHHSPDCAPGDASGEAPTPVGIMRQTRSSCERFAERATTLGLAPIDVERVIGSLARLQRERLAWLLPRLESVRLRRRHAMLCCARAWVDDDLKARVDPGPGSSARNDVLDVAEDLAGLFVDLSSRGASSAGRTLLGEYALRTDDYSLFRAIGLYAPAAACQLASAAIEFAGDCASERERAEALVPLALGSQAASQAAWLFAVGGGVASGKSTLARALADSLGAVRVVADSVRDALLEYPSDVPVHELAWTRTFSPGFEGRVYEGLCRRAEHALATGHPVVLDACFPSARRRIGLTELAARNGAALVFVECRPDAETVRARLEARDERDRASRGWQQLAAGLVARWEPRTQNEPGMHAVLDTGRPVSESLDALRAQIDASVEVASE